MRQIEIEDMEIRFDKQYLKDLYCTGKTEDKAGRESVRVNDQYRIEFKSFKLESEIVVTICNILELSNHYK